MKTNKSTKIFAVLFVLLAAVFTGCSNASSGDDKKTYKVEQGDVANADYMEYQTWRYDTKPVLSFDVLKEKRDSFYSKTIEGSYKDKGNLSDSDLKAYLMENGQEEKVAESAINFANICGNEITVFFSDKTHKKVTWVYIEKK